MRAKVLSSLRRLAVIHPFIVDLLFSVVIAGTTLGFGFALSGSPAELGYTPRPMDATGAGLTLLVNLVLAWRRRAPIAVLVISCGAAVVFHAAGYDPRINEVGALLAVYTVAAHRSPAVSVPCVLPAAASWWHAAFLGPADFVWPNIVQGSIMIAVAWTFGNSTRMLVERNKRLAHLTERLRQEQEDRARRAVTEERLRIARELHDVVAHHMSVILIQAGLAGYVFGSDPATARGALATISDTGSEAMGEMRRLLSVLRVEAGDEGGDDPEEGYDPVPGLQRLEQLVERVRAAGLPVHLSITGSVRPLPPGVDLCAYRVVQECLTNVLKHAGQATAWISLIYGAELTLRVTDDGRGAAEAVPVSQRDGHGLIGMRERVKLYKGTVTAGTKPSGGFEVVVTLPLSPPGGHDPPADPHGEPHT
ncbi:Histidine kinase-, DNA gyrase B-, and HSP90-like ATPase [Nonomuraea solani]|uniref:histidine kinase n=1 Tax=Nonomuraea solani TaxID=1144553 RepID=A0A1H6F2E9_9ACTN|nr:sensor histidine kinase [Nonomuraea solani]SEH03245.1 Histidine kinase-, DNA gyrase B-, and HSP90-like ATPase [Nonomuraea solani]